MRKFWHYLLVCIGLRPCCDKQNLKSVVSNYQYYESECTNCGHIYRDTGSTNQL